LKRASTITTTGNATFHSVARSYLGGAAIVLKLSRNSGSPVDVATAISNSTGTAKVDLRVGSTVAAGGSVAVNSEVVWNHNLASTAGAFRNGIAGVSATVSLFTTYCDAWADGTITAAGDVTVTADSRILTYSNVSDNPVQGGGWNSASYGRNFIASSAAAGSGGIANKVIKGVWA
jgi:hypothetical protein